MRRAHRPDQAPWFRWLAALTLRRCPRKMSLLSMSTKSILSLLASLLHEPPGDRQQPSKDARLERLGSLWNEARCEIRQRIEQRDKYSIQLTVALAALVAVAFSKPELRRVLLAAPLASLYFTVLILYSYRVHDALARYARDVLEPRIAAAVGNDVKTEWENFYATLHVPGIRRVFFVWALWVVLSLSMIYLFLTEGSDPAFCRVLIVTTAVYGSAALALTLYFRR